MPHGSAASAPAAAENDAAAMDVDSVPSDVNGLPLPFPAPPAADGAPRSAPAQPSGDAPSAQAPAASSGQRAPARPPADAPARQVASASAPAQRGPPTSDARAESPTTTIDVTFSGESPAARLSQGAAARFARRLIYEKVQPAAAGRKFPEIESARVFKLATRADSASASHERFRVLCKFPTVQDATYVYGLLRGAQFPVRYAEPPRLSGFVTGIPKAWTESMLIFQLGKMLSAEIVSNGKFRLQYDYERNPDLRTPRGRVAFAVMEAHFAEFSNTMRAHGYHVYAHGKPEANVCFHCRQVGHVQRGVPVHFLLWPMRTGEHACAWPVHGLGTCG